MELEMLQVASIAFVAAIFLLVAVGFLLEREHAKERAELRKLKLDRYRPDRTEKEQQ